MRLLTWVYNNWQSITIRKILNFFWAYFNMIKNYFLPDTSTVDQIEWRVMQVAKKSPACLERAECVHCGCATPDKFWELDGCEMGCYPSWIENFNKKDYADTDNGSKN